MLGHILHQTIIGIRALVIARYAFPALVPCYAQRNAVLGAKLFQLSHYARGYDGRRFGVEEVHESGLQVEFCVDCVREEIGVYEDAVGRAEGFVGHEEHGARGLGAGGLVLVGLKKLVDVERGVGLVWWRRTLLALLVRLRSSFGLRSRRPFGSSA